jgi:hypothetical protein
VYAVRVLHDADDHVGRGVERRCVDREPVDRSCVTSVRAVVGSPNENLNGRVSVQVARDGNRVPEPTTYTEGRICDAVLPIANHLDRACQLKRRVRKRKNKEAAGLGVESGRPDDENCTRGDRKAILRVLARPRLRTGMSRTRISPINEDVDGVTKHRTGRHACKGVRSHAP